MNLIETKNRVEVLDALRGFAVMAILLLHWLEHFIYPVYPSPLDQPEWLNILDTGVESVIFSLFMGKSYSIFAILFGVTFFFQFSSQEKKGNDFGLRFLWRLMILALLATVNAAFFPGGDVMLLFSITGLFLILVRKWSNKSILILSIILLLQPVEWYHYVMSQMDASYTLPDIGVGELYGATAEATKSGNWGEFLWVNITTGQVASLFWAISVGRFLQTAGLLLLGYLIARKQLFKNTEHNIRLWIKILIVSALVSMPLYQLKLDVMGGDEVVAKTVGVVLDMWQKLFSTFVIITSFMLLYQTVKFQKITSGLIVYGKMSLSNYIGQSIIGALILFPIGLNLAPYLGKTLSFLVAIVVLIAQIQFSKWWLKSHKQGPLESLWHKLTWLGGKK